VAEQTVLVVDDEPRIVEFLSENRLRTHLQAYWRARLLRNHTGTTPGQQLLADQDVAVRVERDALTGVSKMRSDLRDRHSPVDLHARPAVP